VREFSAVGRFISHANSEAPVVFKISAEQNYARSQSILSLRVRAELEVAAMKAQKLKKIKRRVR